MMRFGQQPPSPTSSSSTSPSGSPPSSSSSSATSAISSSSKLHERPTASYNGVSYEDYKRFGGILADDFLAYVREDVNPGVGGRYAWKLVKNEKGIRVWERKVNGCPINVLKVETRVSTNAEALMEYICDSTFLARVIPASFKTPKRLLVAYDDEYQITQYDFAASGPIANRDFITMEVSRKLADGVYITAARSANYADCPPQRGVVRAHVWCSGYAIYQESENVSRLVHIVHANPRGNLLPALINMFHVKQPVNVMLAIKAHFAKLTPQLRNTSTDSLVDQAIETQSGNTCTKMFEKMMTHPHIMDQVMSLDAIKKLLKDSQKLKSIMDDETVTGMFDDTQQLEELVDMIISGELSLDDLNLMLQELFGLNHSSIGSGVYDDNDLDAIVVEATYGTQRLRFKVCDDDELMGSGGEEDTYPILGRASPATTQQLNTIYNLTSVDGATASNVQQWSCTFNSPVSNARLRSAWQGLLEQYPQLRTLLLRQTLKARGKGGKEEAKQLLLSSSSLSSLWWQVLPNRSLPYGWREVDWTNKATSEIAQSWEELLRDDLTNTFDLHRLNLLIRVTVVRLPNQQTKFLWSYHSALLDAFSVGFVVRDLFALLSGKHVPAPAASTTASPHSNVIHQPKPISAASAKAPPFLEGSGSGDKITLPRSISPGASTIEKERVQFWKNYLRSIKAPTPLYKCKPTRNKAPTNSCKAIDVPLAPEIVEAVCKLASQRGLPAHLVFLSAWGFLLSRCSGEKRVLFGYLASTPHQLTAAQLQSNGFSTHLSIGCHRPIVPALVNLDEKSQSETDRASAVSKDVLNGIPMWPFIQKLGQQLADAEDHVLSYNHALPEIQKQSFISPEYRLFDSLFVFDSVSPLVYSSFAQPNGSYSFTDGSLNAKFDDSRPFANWHYPLVLHLRGSATSAKPVQKRFSLCYDSNYFAESTAKQISTYFATLVTGIAQAKDNQRIHTLPLLSEEEIRRLAVDMNNNAVEYPREKRIEQLFEEQASNTPDRTAIVFESTPGATLVTMTYSELNKKADQLANYLLSIGCGAGTIVAIYMRRAIEVVISMYACMKSGAAYVPMDPTTPKDRVIQILEDAGVSCVITNEDKAQVLLDTSAGGKAIPCRALCFDKASDLEAINAFPTEPVASTIKANHHSEDLIYIIYTSGTTGRPKGVKICHRGLVNQFQYIRKLPGMTYDDKILGVSTISFDIAQLELVLPLTFGAQIHMVPTEIARDGFRLKELIETSAASSSPITIMQATPATWRMLIAAGWQGEPQRLRIWCGGEAMTCDLAKQLLPRCKGLYNMYGPTETTVWASAIQVLPEHTQGSTIPVGGGVDNSQFFLLDRYQQLVPPGVHGELHIAGDGVGSYVDPIMTNRMYVPNAFRSYFKSTSERMFRVGDVLRYREDSLMEFLGRVDHQVKIRGYRIELEEIMNFLYTHRSVKECLVVAKEPEHEGGERFLVAYVIQRKDATISSEMPGALSVEKREEERKAALVEQLRTLLEEKLPSYMVPAFFVVLDKWPLSPNGKIDRSALPLPTRTSNQANFKYVAPRTDIERTLVEVFKEVLKTSPIGIEDDFFELGGNSLLGVSLIGALEGKFGVRFPFSVIFTASTVRLLATCVEEAIRECAPATSGNGNSNSSSPPASPTRPKTTNTSSPSSPSSTPPPSPVLSQETQGVQMVSATLRQLNLRETVAARAIPTEGQDLQLQTTANKLLSSLNSPLVPLQPQGSRPPIFFVHPAFKSSVCYGALAFLLGNDQPFYGLEPRVPYFTLEAMAADYVAAIRSAQPHGPYRIGGWSFGATVAFEMARQLEATGERLACLMLLDGRAPIYDQAMLEKDLEAYVMCVLCRGAKQFLGFGVEVSYTDIAPLTPDQRLLHVVEKVLDKGALDLVAPAVACSFFFRFQKDIKDSEILTRKYVPQSKFNGKMVLFRSRGSAVIEGIEDRLLELRTLGWDRFCAQSIEVVDTDGDHESVVFQPAVVELASNMRKCLDAHLSD